MADSKKLYIKTYGCQMNVYDSARMVEVLGQEGYVETQTPETADMILLNTCHIREKAAEKVYSELGRLRPLREKNPELKIGVAGCVAQAHGAEIMERQPMVDLVVGPQTYHRLPKMLGALKTGQKAVLDTDFPQEDKFDHMTATRQTSGRVTAFLTVQEGCDKFCSFCVVPYTRGAEVSRPVARVLKEAEELVSKGVKDITLLGQNVNAYHGEGPSGGEWSLARLIWALSDIDGLARIRYTTSHPNEMTDDLIAAHGSCEKLMPYLHLPVQSGSDRILKAMNRKHTAETYLKIIHKLREARPDILVSGDFIVGYPGETEADFEATLALVETVGYGQAYSFKYSARPGTPAAEKPSVPADVADARLQVLQALLAKQQSHAQNVMIGQTIKVLFEKPGRLPGQLIGKTEHNQACHATASPGYLNRIKNVIVEAATSHALSGQLI